MAAHQLLDRIAFIVDDDPAMRALLRRTLTPAGILTEEFESAEEFLDCLEHLRLGCILLDVQLPGMDGMTLLNCLAGAGLPHPVIMVSGHGDVPLAVSAVKAGAIDFVEKPFRAETLIRTVDGAFEVLSRLCASGAGEFAQLTRQEKATLRALAEGGTNKAAAHALGLSVRTVEMHRANALKRLGVSNLTQALFLARDAGYLR